jgi:transcriptional regulator of acetoin/glycerol metabolism
LDEVGEIPLEMQAKLLRVLQERTVRRVGDTRDRPVDVRVIAATNKTVSGLAAPEWLRADLFYRLARAVVRLPSLRERAEDITTMLERELARVSPRRQMSGAFAERCLRHDWPGNARELAAVLRYAERLARDADAARSAAVLLDEQFLPPLQPRTEHAVAEEATPGEITPEVLKAALRAADGNVSAAATKLGVHRNTVHRYMKRFGIDDE